MVLKLRSLTLSVGMPATLYIEEAGSDHFYWVSDMQTHSGPLLFLIPLRQDLARMNQIKNYCQAILGPNRSSSTIRPLLTAHISVSVTEKTFDFNSLLKLATKTDVKCF